MVISSERRPKGRPAMQMTKCVVALIIVLTVCAPCAAQESTAYMLRYEAPFYETELIKMDLPSEYTWPPVEPEVIGQLGMGWVISMAMSPSGQLLALDHEGDRLLEINIETGAASPYVDLDLDISGEYNGIAFDQDGLLWLMNYDYDSGSYLYNLSPQTGETSLVTQLEHSVSQIAVHNGIVYAGRGWNFFEVDTTTGELTLLMDWNHGNYGLALTALHSNHRDLWGIWYSWTGPGFSGTFLGTFFPLDTVVDIVVDGPPHSADQPFALVVVTQPPPTAIPALTTPGLIVFAFLLAGAGILIVRSRLLG